VNKNSANAFKPAQIPQAWDAKALFNKAQLYIEQMLTVDHNDWRFLFWSTLSLELLARAALANISPVLLADGKNWNNILFSIGIQPPVKKFIPKSIDIREVFSRLELLVPEFTTELEGFCKSHLTKRNEELHSGYMPFTDVKSSSWLPTYYRACEVLLKFLDSTLEIYLGKEEADVALKLIKAAKDESAKAVAKIIKDFKIKWSKKDSNEKKKLQSKASLWVTRHKGHRVNCPSCGCDAIVTGTPISAPIKTIEEDEIIETQEYLPNKFECVACGLKISGFSRLSAAGLGDPYKATFIYDAAEYYSPEDEYSGYEPDFNEPF